MLLNLCLQKDIAAINIFGLKFVSSCNCSGTGDSCLFSAAVYIKKRYRVAVAKAALQEQGK